MTGMEQNAGEISPPERQDAAPAVAFIVNRQSGTVRSMGEDAVRSLISASFGPDAEIQLVSGAEVEETVKRLAASGRFQRIIVGGGDGTVTSTAGLLAGSGLAMGILPLGTMNMMAKTLGVGPDLATALQQMKEAEVRDIDAARAADRLFLHHISFGVQPRIVRIRERLGYSSRLTKMLAGLRALVSVLLRPQSQRLMLDIDGRQIEMKGPALIVSNNIYEDSAWLTPARLDEGVLGIYGIRPMSTWAYLRLVLDLLRGRWRENLNVTEEHGRSVRILPGRRRIGRKRRNIRASIDGELGLMSFPIVITSEPQAVKMLVPPSPPA